MRGSSCYLDLPRGSRTPENRQFHLFKVGEHLLGVSVNMNILGAVWQH